MWNNDLATHLWLFMGRHVVTYGTIYGDLCEERRSFVVLYGTKCEWICAAAVRRRHACVVLYVKGSAQGGGRWVSVRRGASSWGERQARGRPRCDAEYSGRSGIDEARQESCNEPEERASC